MLLFFFPYVRSAAHRFRDRPDGAMGPQNEETRVPLAVERLAQIHRLAFRGQAVHVQPQRRQSDHVEREAVHETGQHHIPTR